MASGKGDDNMDLSDSESDEPRRYKSDAHDKNIANLKVRTRFFGNCAFGLTSGRLS